MRAKPLEMPTSVSFGSQKWLVLDLLGISAAEGDLKIP